MIRHDPQPQHYDFDRVMRFIVSAGTIALVIAVLRYLSDVLVPFAVALLIAYLLNPLVNAVERRLKNRAAAVLLTVGGVLATGVLVVMLSIPMVVSQLDDFQGMVMQLRREVATAPGSGAGLAARFDALIDSQSDPRIRWVLEKIRETVTADDFDLEGYVMEAARKLVPGVWGVVTGAVGFLLGLTGMVVVLLYVVFLLNDFRLVEHAWKDQLPPAYRKTVVSFLDEFRLAMSRYFRGQFVVAASVGILLAIGFSLIGLRMGLLLGLFIGMLNMVPYLQTVGFVPAALLSILTAVEHDSSVVGALLMTFGVFFAVQFIQDTVLVPRIMGKVTGLRPAIILLGVFVWGKVLGFLGLVMAIPLTCLGLAYYRRWVLKLRNVQVVADQEQP